MKTRLAEIPASRMKLWNFIPSKTLEKYVSKLELANICKQISIRIFCKGKERIIRLVTYCCFCMDKGLDKNIVIIKNYIKIDIQKLI